MPDRTAYLPLAEGLEEAVGVAVRQFLTAHGWMTTDTLGIASRASRAARLELADELLSATKHPHNEFTCPACADALTAPYPQGGDQ